MTKDFWDSINDVIVSNDLDGTQKFICTIQMRFSPKTVHIYLDEKTTRKAVIRRFIDGASDQDIKDMTPVVHRIVDDLFNRFGSNGYLEWNAQAASELQKEWEIR